MAVNTEPRVRKTDNRIPTVVAVLLLVVSMVMALVAMPTQKTSAAGLPIVNSCQNLTVKKYGKSWWTYKNNTRVSYTGIASNEYGWWRTVDGKVNFNYTGIAKNDYGWWRVAKGKVQFGAEGVFKNEYGWWYVSGGKVQFGYTGVKSNDYGTWRIEHGKVNFGYNGLAPDESGVWYYLESGKVNFNHEGLVLNENGTWYVKDGKVAFGYSGDYHGYTIQNGQVVGTPNIATEGAATSTSTVAEGTTDATDADASTTSSTSGTTTTTETTTTTVKGTVPTTTTDGILTDKNGNVVVEDTGIVVDISKWNGTINFETLKNSGVKGVMMRAAYATKQDEKFATNSKECERLGIDYGVYQFATFHYGTTKEAAMTKAKTQADALLSILQGRTITGYVTLDMELESGYKLAMTPAELTEVCNYYFGLIEAAGYKPMLYCSVSWLQNNMVASNVNVPLWIAYYNDTGSYNYPNTGYGKYMASVSGRITMWQYTEKGEGSTYGVESDYIDLNRLYHSFTGATA